MRIHILRLTAFALLILAASPIARAESQAEQSHSPAHLAGTLWWISPADAECTPGFWETELNLIQALGMDTLVLNGPFVDAPFLDTFLAETDRRNMHVYIDTLSAPNWWTLTDPTEEIARANARIDRLHAQYGQHASFEGWYIPYELYVFWDAQAELITRLYTDVAAHCKRISPTKKVMISPFFILDRNNILGTFRFAEPLEYQSFWTSVLKSAQGIDIVALQDSGEHLSLYTMADRQPFFAAMKSACDATGKTLWANIETAELEVASFDDYVARFGKHTHVNDPKLAEFWRGVPAEKLAEKLRFAGQHTSTAITWGYREMIRPGADPKAPKNYESYLSVLAPARPAK